jgi:hypothetical protein
MNPKLVDCGEISGSHCGEYEDGSKDIWKKAQHPRRQLYPPPHAQIKPACTYILLFLSSQQLLNELWCHKEKHTLYENITARL